MRKLLCIALLLCAGISAHGETIYAGPVGSDLLSLTEALEMAQDGDVILLADGTYDESREKFPLMVEKTVTICPAEGAQPVLVSPAQTTAMEITGRGAVVQGLRFEHIRCAMWILTDDVTVENCTVSMADEAWRTSSCGIWLAGGKRTTLRNNVFEGCGMALAGPPISESSAGLPGLTAMFEVGEDIEFFNTHTVENNLVNGKPLVYLLGVKEQEWSEEAGQLVAVQCENMRFVDVEVEMASIGIQLAYCRDIEIDNCRASKNGIFGIYIMKCDDCVLTDTRADSCSHGIDVRDARRVWIADCITDGCGQGTFLSWGDDCLVQRCEILDNGTGFFSASGNNNHVDDCRIEGNELGLYIQHEPIFTLTNTQVNKNTACGLRVTDCGLISVGNTFRKNFVGHLALDCYPLTHMECTFADSEDCDMLIRNGRDVKLVDIRWDGPVEEKVKFVDTERYLITK